MPSSYFVDWARREARVLYLLNIPRNMAYLTRGTGWSPKIVQATLERLVDDGRVQKPRTGPGAVWTRI